VLVAGSFACAVMLPAPQRGPQEPAVAGLDLAAVDVEPAPTPPEPPATPTPNPATVPGSALAASGAESPACAGPQGPAPGVLGSLPDQLTRAPTQKLASAVSFVSNPSQAVRQAQQEGKLLFLLHVSGNFEDVGFT
jgi:hypothetical protein